MAVKFVILAALAFLTAQTEAASLQTYASTYNAHSIQHAVAYPVGGSKVSLPAAVATPAVVATPVAAVTPTIATAPAIFGAHIPAAPATSAIASTPSIVSTSNTSQNALAGQLPVPVNASTLSQIPFVVPGQAGFVATPFGLAAPGKVTFATAPAYSPAYATHPAYAVAPAYGAVPAYATGPAYAAYAQGTIAFSTPNKVGLVTAAAPTSVAFAAAPSKVAYPAYSIASAPIALTGSPSKVDFHSPAFAALPYPYAAW